MKSRSWICVVGLIGVLLPLAVRAHGQHQRSPNAANVAAHPSQPQAGNPATSKDGAILFSTRHQVALPSGDPRRLRLPLVRAGTVVELDVQPGEGVGEAALSSVELELLRDDREDGRGLPLGGQRSGTLQSVARSTGPWQTPVRYRAPWDGRYLVVLRQVNQERRAINLVVAAQISRMPDVPAEPYMLSKSTRIAVAVFSGGLLWTTLLVCGVPIIRAFRSRRRPVEPSWYA